MWYLQEREHALYLPPIFSWLAALATLSRLPLDFSSGSAIFPLKVSPLVLSFSSCPPLLFFTSSLYVPFLPPVCLSIPLPSHTLSLSLICPLSLSLTHTRAHTHTFTSSFARLRHSDWNSSDPDPLCLSLPPYLFPGYNREEPNLCDAAAA